MTSFCAAEDRCRGYDWRNRVPAIVQVGALCEICLRVGAHAVGMFPYDYVDLEQQIPRAAGGGEYVTGTKDEPVPIALHIEALQRAIWLLAVTWEEILRDVDRLSAPATRVRDGCAVQRAVAIIQPRVFRLALLPPTLVMPHGPDGDPAEQSGADAILAMITLHGRVGSTLGLTKLVHELPGECSQCGLPTLRRDDGTEVVYCGNCYAAISTDDYRCEVGLALAAHKLLTRRSGVTGGNR